MREQSTTLLPLPQGIPPLRVTDNGVGMTEEVIKNYFTQIGKRYYRSPEFNQERAAVSTIN